LKKAIMESKESCMHDEALTEKVFRPCSDDTAASCGFRFWPNVMLGSAEDW
jgi:hypothetical protein